MKIKLLLALLFCGMTLFSIHAQSLSLEECIETAHKNNLAIKVAEQSVETREQFYEGAKKNYLPKVDLLAGYNYIGKPLKINMTGNRNNLLDGTSSQIANAGGLLFENITGEPISQDFKDQLYESSYGILDGLYPDHNPVISKKAFFMGGLFARQPIYTGGKLDALKELTYQELKSGRVMLDNSKELISFNTAVQYIQVLYFNSMIRQQEEIVKQLVQINEFADAAIKSEVLPPYQKGWAEVALAQGETSLQHMQMEKENSLTALKHLMGVEDDELIVLDTAFPEELSELALLSNEDIDYNTDVRLLESLRDEAEVAVKVAKSGYKPNIFAIGNLQLWQSQVPIITPPWLIGVELQWNLFDGFKTRHDVKAAESFKAESQLLIDQKKKAVDLGVKVSANEINSLLSQIETLDKARKQSYTTTSMVQKRLEHGLASVVNVNEAVQLQLTAEKAYYTAVMAYYTAAATNFYLKGHIDDFPKTMFK